MKHQLRKNKSKTLASHIKEQCLLEAGEGGTLEGPFTSKEITEQLGESWVPVPRFGVGQGEKIRLVDDASVYLHNATVISLLKLTLGGIDQLAALARTWLQAVGEDRMVRIRFPDGKVRQAPLRAEWTVESARTLMGRLLDLRNATSKQA